MNRPGLLDGHHYSFLDTGDANLLLQAWKPAEDGRGTILRLFDSGDEDRTVAVTTPSLCLEKVWNTDAVENDKSELPLVNDRSFQIHTHPHEVITARILSRGIATALGTCEARSLSD